MANSHKSDGRSKNGGFRHGAGRKSGTGTETVNKVIRMPVDIIKEAEDAGIKKGKFTKTIIDGFKDQIKKHLRLKAKKASNDKQDND